MLGLLFALSAAITAGESLAQSEFVGGAPTSCIKSRDRSVRATGGTRARIEDWPFFVALGLPSSDGRAKLFYCGGVQISERWILTAAHCVDRVLPDQSGQLFLSISTSFKRYRGAPDVLTATDDLMHYRPVNVVEVDRVVVHPDYRDAQSTGHDIALLKLKHKTTRPIARLSASRRFDPPDRDDQVDRKVIGGTKPDIDAALHRAGAISLVAGFGLTVGEGETEVFQSRHGTTIEAGSSVLFETELPIAKLSSCRRVHSGAIIGDGQICAGYDAADPRKRRRDSCDGDSGGPLVVLDRNGCPYVVGIVSWGPKDCGRPMSYGVYTRVSAYVPWISSQVDDPITITHTEPNTAVYETNAIISEFDRLIGQAAGKIQLSIRGGATVPIGNSVIFEVSSESSGRLIIIDVDATGVATLIFPNQHGSQRPMIDRGQTIIIPGENYGFTSFRASEPVGKGRLISFVLPEETGASLAPLIEPQKSKGFAPIESGAGYLTNILRHVSARVERDRRAGEDTKTVFGFGILEYEITAR